MRIVPIRTEKIRTKRTTLVALIDTYVQTMHERSVLAVTSKIVSLCEGRVFGKQTDKQSLIQREADLYLSPDDNKYGICLTIKGDILIPAAGIDQSNADGKYVLWPKDPQKTANVLRAHLSKRFSLKHVGVLITDSRVLPLRWGTVGVALSHSGFAGINDFIGTKDLFGRKFEVTKVNVRDGLAAASVLVMGESVEQTPFAIIDDVPFVQFQDRDPTPSELQALSISLENDIYGPILRRAPWKRGTNLI